LTLLDGCAAVEAQVVVLFFEAQLGDGIERLRKVGHDHDLVLGALGSDRVEQRAQGEQLGAVEIEVVRGGRDTVAGGEALEELRLERAHKLGIYVRELAVAVLLGCDRSGGRSGHFGLGRLEYKLRRVAQLAQREDADELLVDGRRRERRSDS